MTNTEKNQINDLGVLLENEELEGWEEEFVADMVERRFEDEDFKLTEKQSDKLEQIWKEHCQ